MFYVFPTAQDIARFVSAQMHQLIRTQQRLVLGLATGSTMKPVYAQFIDKYQEQNCSLEHVHCFNLDEYIGLPAEHPQTYAADRKSTRLNSSHVAISYAVLLLNIK